MKPVEWIVLALAIIWVLSVVLNGGTICPAGKWDDGTCKEYRL